MVKSLISKLADVVLGPHTGPTTSHPAVITDDGAIVPIPPVRRKRTIRKTKAPNKPVKKKKAAKSTR